MAKIDNELLAEKGLGWKKLSKESPHTRPNNGVTFTNGYLALDGTMRYTIPNFAEDPAACFELIRRLPDAWDVTLFNKGNRWGCRISDPFTWCRGYGLDRSLESAIAMAFTALFKAELTRIGDV